jgi:hypothetical protein
MRTNRQLRPRSTGLRVVGPGYYVWDADSREALRLARELEARRGAPPRNPTTSACSRGPRRLPEAST